MGKNEISLRIKELKDIIGKGEGEIKKLSDQSNKLKGQINELALKVIGDRRAMEELENISKK